MQLAFTWNELSANAEHFHLNLSEFNSLKDFFQQLDPAFFQSCASKTLENFPMASVQQKFDVPALAKFLFLCSVANYNALDELYAKNGWPVRMKEEIVPDFLLWANTMKRDYGFWGLSPRIFSWAVACLTGQVKSFGRLQGEDIHNFYLQFSVYRSTENQLRSMPAFQPGNPPRPDLTYGDKCINIHIPASGPLSREACIRSFKRMCGFSETFHPDYDFKAIVCYSWILDPVFQQLLAPTSNIVQFQKLGHLLPLENDETNEIIWRIWGEHGKKIPVEQLAESSSLAKCVKKHLLQGQRFHEGLLIIFKDELHTLLGD